jgi:hypothetical protein
MMGLRRPERLTCEFTISRKDELVMTDRQSFSWAVQLYSCYS